MLVMIAAILYIIEAKNLSQQSKDIVRWVVIRQKKVCTFCT